MQSTIELLDQVLQDREISARALSLHLGHSPWTLNRARERGTLSPLLAGQLAQLMELDIEHWMALASLESEPDSPLKTKLRKAIDITRNS